MTAVDKALRRTGAVARGRELKVEKPLQITLCLSDWKDMDMAIDMVNILDNIKLRVYTLYYGFGMMLVFLSF